MEHRGLKVRMALVGVVLLVVCYFVVGTLGLILQPFLPGEGNVAFVVAMVLTGLVMAVQHYAGTRLMLDVVDARPLDPDAFPEIHEQAERLSESMEMPTPKLMIADIDAPNAFAIGRKSDGYVVVSETLVELLEPDELETIIGHELAHLDNHDVVVMTMASTIIWLAATLTTLLITVTIAVTAFCIELMVGIVSRGRSAGTPINWEKVGGTVAPLGAMAVLLFITLFQRALSRHREFVADAQSARYTGKPDALASGLEKVRQADHPEQELDDAGELSALFIFGESEGVVGKALADHPSIDKRIRALDSMDPVDSDARSTTPDATGADERGSGSPETDSAATPPESSGSRQSKTRSGYDEPERGTGTGQRNGTD